MADRLPGFLFDVENWFGSVATQRMSFAEKGVYLVMLFQQWREGSNTLPDDAADVADLICVTDAQRAEVLAAWTEVRKKFCTDRRTPNGRMFNARLERTRRKQRASWLKKVKAGQRGGNSTSRKRLKDLEEVEQQCLSDAAAVPHRSDLNRSDLNRSDLREAIAPRGASMLDGGLPRDHMRHVFCAPDFSVCVPPQVHAKFIGPLQRKFDDDRQRAHDALLTFYGETAKSLPPEFVMGDAFRFWQPRFDAAFASPDTAGPSRFGKQTSRLLHAHSSIQNDPSAHIDPKRSAS